jgi:dolichol kinase
MGATSIEIKRTSRLSREEVTRKLLHLIALVMPLGIFYLPRWSFPRSIAPIFLTALFAGSVLIEMGRFGSPAVQRAFFRFFGWLLRKEERFKIAGSTWVMGAAALCSILFFNATYVSCVALSLFVIGDAAAALVGISMGRIKIGKKSLEGSLACFLSCIALSYGLFPFLPGLLNRWGGTLPFSLVLVTAAVVTVFELVPLRITPNIAINDNLAVPVIAGYAMLGMEKLLGM